MCAVPSVYSLYIAVARRCHNALSDTETYIIQIVNLEGEYIVSNHYLEDLYGGTS